MNDAPQRIAEALAEAGLALGDEARAELERTEVALKALASGDLTASQSSDGPDLGLARAVNAAAEELGRRIEPLLNELPELNGTLRRLGDALGEGEIGLDDQPTIISEARDSLSGMSPRLAEVAEVSRRLEDVAAQAAVASLNVSLEVSRGESASEETLTTLAEEVRRLADRTGTATRRVSTLIREMDEGAKRIDSRLDRASSAHQLCAEQGRRARAYADDLGAALEAVERAAAGIRLPAARASQQALRLQELRRRLEEEISQIDTWGDELPVGVNRAMNELRALLVPGADEMGRAEDP